MLRYLPASISSSGSMDMSTVSPSRVDVFSVFAGQKNGRGRPIGLRNHPNSDVSARAIRTQDPEAMGDREVILPLVLVWHLSPIPRLMALDECHGRLPGLCQC